MQWADVTVAPPRRRLKQFAAIFLVVFGALAGWRAWQGDTGLVTRTIGVAAVLVGLAGLVWPPAVRVVYTGWMMAAFPIGWAVSRLVLAALFYLVFTPLAFVFRLMGRDALRLRHRDASSYWLPYEGARKPADYFRQS
jgi:hypothetical protein